MSLLGTNACFVGTVPTPKTRETFSHPNKAKGIRCPVLGLYPWYALRDGAREAPCFHALPGAGTGTRAVSEEQRRSSGCIAQPGSVIHRRARTHRHAHVKQRR
ncbi:hypothetical protein MHYP_G00291610 [Metynnis hypsauchen]